MHRESARDGAWGAKKIFLLPRSVGGLVTDAWISSSLCSSQLRMLDFITPDETKSVSSGLRESVVGFVADVGLLRRYARRNNGGHSLGPW